MFVIRICKKKKNKLKLNSWHKENFILIAYAKRQSVSVSAGSYQNAKSIPDSL